MTTERDNFAALTKVAVRALADTLRNGAADDVAACVRFVCADTGAGSAPRATLAAPGLWHGRGRAMMCRRLKHLEVTADQRRALVTAISGRLLSGRFAQQFRDELRLLLALDRNAAVAAASAAIQSDAEHVRRLGRWLFAAAERR